MSNFNEFQRAAKAAIRVALQWFFLAIPTGLICGLVGTLFHLSVERVTERRADQPSLLFLLPAILFLLLIVLLVLLLVLLLLVLVLVFRQKFFNFLQAIIGLALVGQGSGEIGGFDLP